MSLKPQAIVGHRKPLQQISAGALDRASEPEKDRAASELIAACSAAAGALALQPLPLVDLPLIVPIQIAMVQGLGRIRGYQLDKKSVLEVFRSYRTSLTVQQLTIAVSKVVPGVGSLFSVSTAYALTFAVGEVSDRYFKGGRKLAPEELRRLFERIYAQTRREKREAGCRKPNLERDLAEPIPPPRAR
jgi:uncharacterized protein (DUF697 family)